MESGGGVELWMNQGTGHDEATLQVKSEDKRKCGREWAMGVCLGGLGFLGGWETGSG